MHQYIFFPLPMNELLNIFIGIKTRREARALALDLFTPRELASFCERLQIVKLLRKGVPHRLISKKLNVSIDKVTRGAKALRGSRGFFKRIKP